MPYNGVGQFTSLGAPIFPAVPNTFILASYFNSTMNDVFQGLSGVITRDGQAPATANLPMAGFTLTNIAAAVANWQPIAYGQSGAKLNELTVDALLTIPNAASVTLAGDVTAAATSIADYTLGTLRVATQMTGDSTTKAASTAFVADAITSLPGGSLPALTGQAGGVLVVNPDEATVSWEKRYQGDITGDSTSSVVLSVATGKVFTVQSGKSWTAGDLLTIYHNFSNYMSCRVVSYSGTTLTVDCFEAVGSGTYAAWAIASGSAALYRLPIFSAETINSEAASVLEDITLPSYQAIPASSNQVASLCVGNSLFLCAQYITSSSIIATSPDGVTWTSRAMPTAASWILRTNGTNRFIGVGVSVTNTAKSTDGTTWTAAAVLPGTSNANYFGTFNGNDYLALGAGTAAYLSTDNGASWSTQTLPATPIGSLQSIGGLFWFPTSTTVAYTSASGVTGTWTARTLPEVMGPTSYYHISTEGKLVGSISSDVTQRVETVDGINWTYVPYRTSIYDVTLNGVRCVLRDTFGTAKSWHNGKPVIRSCTKDTIVSHLYTIGKLGDIICLTNISDIGWVSVFNPATFAPSAIFSR